MPDYGSALYWQERYAHDPTSSFDWYMTYDTLRPYLSPYMSGQTLPDFEVLVPGCGTSTLSARMYEDGVKNISNIDISSVCISQVRDRYAAMPEMDFSVMDATDMKKDLPDACFDLVVDKALMDSLLCGDDAFRRVVSMISEMHRVLKPGGVYVVLSYGAPDTRMGYFTAAVPGAPEVVEIPKPKLDGFKEPAGATATYYMYVCRKPAAE